MESNNTNNKVEFTKTEGRIMVASNLWARDDGKMSVKGCKLSVISSISAEYLMHSVLTIVNNTVLYT